jgi:ribosomal protein S18 acetylase RimI-like enzyme
MNIHLRAAVLADAPRIKTLLAQLGYPDLEMKAVEEKIISYQKENYRLFVTEVDNQVVAFISLHWFELMHWKDKFGRITSFCVDEKCRSLGLGKEIMDYVEKFLFDQGCIKIEVTSNNRRTRAHDFYLKLGYIEDARRFMKMRK